jgi:hypothetical protein
MEGRVAILVVLLFLLRIRENGIGFRYFLEAFLRLLVVRVFVRMIFQCQFTVGFFDLVGNGGLFKTENGIII